MDTREREGRARRSPARDLPRAITCRQGPAPGLPVARGQALAISWPGRALPRVITCRRSRVLSPAPGQGHTPQLGARERSPPCSCLGERSPAGAISPRARDLLARARAPSVSTLPRARARGLPRATKNEREGRLLGSSHSLSLLGDHLGISFVRSINANCALSAVSLSAKCERAYAIALSVA